MWKLLLSSLLFFLGASLSANVSHATVEFAGQTGLACGACHIDEAGGGPLTHRGKQFLADRQARGLSRRLTTTQHVVRLLVGYFHMMAAVIWFGAILYVHLLLKPAYAAKGLPKGELRLGWISMIILLITGILLTVAKMPSWQAFYTTRFGILLSMKIALFMVMFTSALIVTLFIGPRLRKKKGAAVAENVPRDLTPEELAHYDGKEERPACVAYKGTIYTVTLSRLWKDGSHLKKHAAGQDLTALLKTAPHGEEKVLAMPVFGKLLYSVQKPAMPFHIKLFYFMAYMNLSLTFVIVFIISLWRWW
jgi:predicted heme/steroid binding protein/uncharacterized membrane protein